MRSELPPGWMTASVGDLTVNLDRRRIPLSGPERSTRPGPYGYWGANGRIDSIDDYIFDGPHVLLAEDGNTVVRRNGKATVHWVGGRFWVNNHAHVLRAAEGVDLRWLYFALSDVEIRPFVTGSAQPKLNQANLNAVVLPTPPLADQERIAGSLAALDDKIDSDRRVAERLTDIAGGEFEARFVKFVGGDGWDAGELGQIATVHRELVKGDDGRPYIGLDLMPRGSTILTEWITEESPTGQAATFQPGDILFGKLRPYFRKVGVAPIAGRCSTEILVVRPTRPEYYGLVLGHLASQRFIDHCNAVSRGTRMPRAEWKEASVFQIAIPPGPVAAEFTVLVKSLYRQIIALTHESRTLRLLRDALLPKLISGGLRVPDTGDPEEVIRPAAEHAVA